MKNSVKIGLFVGAGASFINICVASFLGFCSPVAAIIAGGFAGFLVTQREGHATRGDGAREGAIAGAIVGGLMLASQMLIAIFNLAIIQQRGIELPIGTLPDPGADPPLQAIFYTTALGVGACIGLADVVFAASSGTLGGYLGTPSQSAQSNDEFEHDSI